MTYFDGYFYDLQRHPIDSLASWLIAKGTNRSNITAKDNPTAMATCTIPNDSQPGGDTPEENTHAPHAPHPPPPFVHTFNPLSQADPPDSELLNSLKALDPSNMKSPTLADSVSGSLIALCRSEYDSSDHPPTEHDASPHSLYYDPEEEDEEEAYAGASNSHPGYNSENDENETQPSHPETTEPEHSYDAASEDEAAAKVLMGIDFSRARVQFESPYPEQQQQLEDADHASDQDGEIEEVTDQLRSRNSTESDLEQTTECNVNYERTNLNTESTFVAPFTLQVPAAETHGPGQAGSRESQRKSLLAASTDAWYGGKGSVWEKILCGYDARCEVCPDEFEFFWPPIHRSSPIGAPPVEAPATPEDLKPAPPPAKAKVKKYNVPAVTDTEHASKREFLSQHFVAKYRNCGSETEKKQWWGVIAAFDSYCNGEDGAFVFIVTNARELIVGKGQTVGVPAAGVEGVQASGNDVEREDLSPPDLEDELELTGGFITEEPKRMIAEDLAQLDREYHRDGPEARNDAKEEPGATPAQPAATGNNEVLQYKKTDVASEVHEPKSVDELFELAEHTRQDTQRFTVGFEIGDGGMGEGTENRKELAELTEAKVTAATEIKPPASSPIPEPFKAGIHTSGKKPPAKKLKLEDAQAKSENSRIPPGTSEQKQRSDTARRVAQEFLETLDTGSGKLDTRMPPVSWNKYETGKGNARPTAETDAAKGLVELSKSGGTNIRPQVSNKLEESRSDKSVAKPPKEVSFADAGRAKRREARKTRPEAIAVETADQTAKRWAKAWEEDDKVPLADSEAKDGESSTMGGYTTEVFKAILRSVPQEDGFQEIALTPGGNNGEFYFGNRPESDDDSEYAECYDFLDEPPTLSSEASCLIQHSTFISQHRATAFDLTIHHHRPPFPAASTHAEIAGCIPIPTSTEYIFLAPCSVYSGRRACPHPLTSQTPSPSSSQSFQRTTLHAKHSLPTFNLNSHLDFPPLFACVGERVHSTFQKPSNNFGFPPHPTTTELVVEQVVRAGHTGGKVLQEVCRVGLGIVDWRLQKTEESKGMEVACTSEDDDDEDGVIMVYGGGGGGMMLQNGLGGQAIDVAGRVVKAGVKKALTEGWKWYNQQTEGGHVRHQFR